MGSDACPTIGRDSRVAWEDWTELSGSKDDTQQGQTGGVEQLSAKDRSHYKVLLHRSGGHSIRINQNEDSNGLNRCRHFLF